MTDPTSSNIPSKERIRLAVFIFYFCQGIVFSSWASRIPDIKTSLGLDDGAWGTILLMIPVGQVCGMTLSGLLVSKLGSKKILPISLPCYTLALLAIGLSQSEYVLIMCLILFGFFGNFCNIAVNTQGVNVENIYGKSIMSSFHGGWSLAGFAGSLIGLIMINLKLSPFHHYIFVVCIVSVLIALNYRYLQTDKKKKQNAEEKEMRKKNRPEAFLFLLGLTAFCGMVAEGTMFDWSGIYFRDIVKVPESLVPLGFTAFMVMMAGGRFFADKAVGRYGKQKVIQSGGFLISLGLIIAVIYPHIVLTAIAFMIIGLGTSSIVPIIYSTAGQKTKISTGMALTIVSSVSFLGFLLGPPLIGYISYATNLRYSYILVSLFGICIIILASMLKIFKEDKKSS